MNSTSTISLRRALEKVYGLVMGKVGSQVVQKAVAKAFADGAGAKEEFGRHEQDFEGRWMITVTEAAGLLGVSRTKMYELAASGQVPSITLGRSRRIVLKDLQEWIEAHKNEGRR